MYKVTFSDGVLKQALYPATVSIEELTQRLESQGLVVVMVERSGNLDQSHQVFYLCHRSRHRVPSVAIQCGIAQWPSHLHTNTRYHHSPINVGAPCQCITINERITKWTTTALTARLRARFVTAVPLRQSYLTTRLCWKRQATGITSPGVSC